MKRRAISMGLAAAAIFACAVGAGYAIGGADFVKQHLRPLLVAALAVASLLTLLLWTLAGVVRGAVLAIKRPQKLGQSGAAAAEFVIVVIPFMLMLTALMQLALASLARVLVSYAAFAAARAAIVIVPADPSSLPGNQNANDSGPKDGANSLGTASNVRTDFAISQKAAMIRNAASFAMIPASPSIDVVVADTMNNWPQYIAARATHGLSPLNYLKGILGDTPAIAQSVLDNLSQQIGNAVNSNLSQAGKKAAENQIDAWIDGQSGLSQKQKDDLKQAANSYIDGGVDAAGGVVGGAVTSGINDVLSGPLSQYKDQVNNIVNGAIGSAGGNFGGNFGGYAVDRALDVGFGSGTDGASGAILRSLRKLVYAKMATVVTLLDEKGNYKTQFDWNEPIRARVTHLFYCQIPLANRFAGKAFYDLPDTTVMDLATGPAKSITIVGIPGYFMTLTAEHTMVNQGKP
jgi:hypothetical protein